MGPLRPQLHAAANGGPSDAGTCMHKHHDLLLVHFYWVFLQTADTDGFGWLDFDMEEEKKLQLFKRGADAGCDLLKT
jgi:hypothetical protein